MFAMIVRHSYLLLQQHRYYPLGRPVPLPLLPARSSRRPEEVRLLPWRLLCAAEGMREVDAAVAMTALRYEGNSVRYGDISGLVDQSEVHVDVQVRGPSMLVFSGACVRVP